MRKERILAVIMSVLLALSMISATVFAAEIPALDGKLKIQGTAAEGRTLSAEFKEVKPEGVTEDDVAYLWERKTVEDEETEKAGEKPELKELGKDKTYTVTQDDIGSKIVLTVTGKEENGYTGSLKVVSDTVIDAQTAAGQEVKAAEEKAAAADTAEQQAAQETENEQSQNTDASADTEETTQTGVSEDTDTTYQEDSIQAGTENIEGIPAATTDEEKQQSESAGSESVDGIPEATEDGTYGQTNDAADTADSQKNNDTGKTETPTADASIVIGDGNSEVVDFGTVISGQEDSIQAQYVTVTNTGNTTLNFTDISPEHFMVQDITEPLSAGESVSVWIQPREGLEPGEYDDMITYRTEEGIEVSFEAKIAVEGEDDSSDDEDLKPSDEPSAEPTETPDDSEAPSAGDNADASLEAQSLEVNTGSLNFSDIEENYTQANETLSVTVINTGDGIVTLKIPKSDYFEVMNEDGSEAVSGIQIAKGDSLMFMVQPKTGLTKGDYSDTLIFESEEDSEVAAQVTAEVSVKEAEQEQITAVQADPESFSYDDLKEGYDTPEATTITLTNTGNTTVSLMQPYAEYFDIGELSASVLEPGDSAAFTAVPVTGLKVGNYLDSIQIAQTSSEGQEDVLTTIKASATVSEVKKIYKLSVTPEELNFGKAKEGYSEAPEAQKVTVTNEGNTNVTLNAPSGKNFKIGKLSATELAPGESCTFKIRPKAGLKAGSYTESVVIDNEQQISAEVKVQFTVKATRKAKIADPADNKITGISSDGYTTQSKITFTAVGAGMDNESPGKGDVRYVPYNWKVINTNSWSSAPYTAAFGITKAGTYTLTVTFDRQKYNGSEWENTGEQDTKQVNFSITQAQTVTATPTPQPNGASAKTAVKTGDTTNITPFVIILAIAAGCIVGVVVYKRRKK